MDQKGDSTSGLDWEREFLYLLNEMDKRIEHGGCAPSQREKDIRYQTMYAIAAFFSPSNNSFLSVSWDDIIEKGIYDKFRLDVGLSRDVYFPQELIQIAEKNYNRIDPINKRHLVLSKSDNPIEPVNIRQFNANFERDLKKVGIVRDKASTITLRRTLGLHVLNDIGNGDLDGLLMACKLLGHKSIDQTMDLLQIPSKEREKYTYSIYKRL